MPGTPSRPSAGLDLVPAEGLGSALDLAADRSADIPSTDQAPGRPNLPRSRLRLLRARGHRRGHRYVRGLVHRRPGPGFHPGAGAGAAVGRSGGGRDSGRRVRSLSRRELAHRRARRLRPRCHVDRARADGRPADNSRRQAASHRPSCTHEFAARHVAGNGAGRRCRRELAGNAARSGARTVVSRSAQVGGLGHQRAAGSSRRFPATRPGPSGTGGRIRPFRRPSAPRTAKARELRPGARRPASGPERPTGRCRRCR